MVTHWATLTAAAKAVMIACMPIATIVVSMIGMSAPARIAATNGAIVRAPVASSRDVRRRGVAA
ncbi:hypothetical protein GCM10022230_09680 [Pseudoclavibacter caeni]